MDTGRNVRISVMGFLLLTPLAWIGCGGGGDNSPPAATVTPTVAPVPTATAIPVSAGAGLTLNILSASVATDPAGQVVVTFVLTDSQGIPLQPSLTAVSSAQQARTRFTLAHLEEYSGGGDLANTFQRYVNDVNTTRPAYDTKGTLAVIDAASGRYQFTFAVTLPANYDPTQTYVIGVQADRTFAGQAFSANPVFDFVPAGGTPVVREATTTQQCNSCHNPLTAHGTRHEVRLCLTCHTEAAVDGKGTTIQFRNLVHKIHAGKDLPSVVNGPPGSFYGIFSSFSNSYTYFAQKDENGNVTGVGFPRSLDDCAVCHTDGPTAAFHLQKASTAACATCHDDVNPSQVDTAAGPPGTKHSPGNFPDGQCAACHKAEMAEEFDVTVPGAHVIPERSSHLQGLNLAITGITNHAAGQIPTISFKVTDNAGNALRDLSGLNRVGFAIAGPTTDYSTVSAPTAFGGGASGTLSPPDADGVFQYTPTTALPADATGTWSVGAEARRSVVLTSSVTVNEAATNPVVTFTVDDSTVVVRREVVDGDNCAKCHGPFSKGFSIHGNLRNNTEYCVLCHNPNASDVSRRSRDQAAVARGDQTGSIDFKVLIHKIHRGENLEHKPYLIYGFGPAPQNYAVNDFSEVLFPGDLRDCEKCHAKGTELLPPFPGTAIGTQVAHLDPATAKEVVDGRLGPITSVCTTCHDGDDAKAHTDTQTAPDGGEACPVCHEEGREFAVSGLHAR